MYRIRFTHLYFKLLKKANCQNVQKFARYGLNVFKFSLNFVTISFSSLTKFNKLLIAKSELNGDIVVW